MRVPLTFNIILQRPLNMFSGMDAQTLFSEGLQRIKLKPSPPHYDIAKLDEPQRPIDNENSFEPATIFNYFNGFPFALRVLLWGEHAHKHEFLTPVKEYRVTPVGEQRLEFSKPDTVPKETLGTVTKDGTLFIQARTWKSGSQYYMLSRTSDGDPTASIWCSEDFEIVYFIEHFCERFDEQGHKITMDNLLEPEDVDDTKNMAINFTFSEDGFEFNAENMDRAIELRNELRFHNPLYDIFTFMPLEEYTWRCNEEGHPECVLMDYFGDSNPDPDIFSQTPMPSGCIEYIQSVVAPREDEEDQAGNRLPTVRVVSLRKIAGTFPPSSFGAAGHSSIYAKLKGIRLVDVEHVAGSETSGSEGVKSENDTPEKPKVFDEKDSLPDLIPVSPWTGRRVTTSRSSIADSDGSTKAQKMGKCVPNVSIETAAKATTKSGYPYNRTYDCPEVGSEASEQSRKASSATTAEEESDHEQWHETTEIPDIGDFPKAHESPEVVSAVEAGIAAQQKDVKGTEPSPSGNVHFGTDQESHSHQKPATDAPPQTAKHTSVPSTPMEEATHKNKSTNAKPKTGLPGFTGLFSVPELEHDASTQPRDKPKAFESAPQDLAHNRRELLGPSFLCHFLNSSVLHCEAEKEKFMDLAALLERDGKLF